MVGSIVAIARCICEHQAIDLAITDPCLGRAASGILCYRGFITPPHQSTTGFDSRKFLISIENERLFVMYESEEFQREAYKTGTISSIGEFIAGLVKNIYAIVAVPDGSNDPVTDTLTEYVVFDIIPLVYMKRCVNFVL
ncbi:hypothetical protein XU18_2711 [Perkinsela sp. CCAP 1560/4]|nr:hypothetical protein XU18_2711 [Perkinsela sp. CCAP 1560/4]|eukprot:KNH06429.1 hypothetical protein XU18_2711 [Perkinsela sp. CCAP 1560/4]